MMMPEGNTKNETGCFSESGHPSELEDMNQLLEQMENKSYKGFRESDCDSDDQNVNECICVTLSYPVFA
jgi:hypothetical protein